MSALDEPLSPQDQFARDELASAYREVFRSAAGKRVLFDILTDCAIYSDAFSGDDNYTNYQLGLQSAGRKLISKLDALDARFYPSLLLEIADLKAMDLAAANKQAAKTGENDDDLDD